MTSFEPHAGRSTRQGARQFTAYLLVGGSGAVAFIALSTLLIGLPTGLPKWLASALCYGALIVPVYLAHRRFSFRTDAPHRQALPRYVGVQLAAVGLTAVFSLVAYAVPGVPVPVAAFCVSALTAASTFALLKLWAFAGPA